MITKHSLYFSFNGVSSEDFGILNVTTSTGLYEENFLHKRKINETKIRGRSKPYFQEVEQEKIEFDVEFLFEDAWDEDKINAVARWLCTDYYAPMSFSESPEKIYHCMLEGDSSIIHNGCNNGYLKLHFVCSDSYIYSPIYQTQTYTTALEDIAESETTTTNIKMTTHGLSNGDYIINVNRSNAIRQVTKVDNNNVTVSFVAGQTSGDLILKYSNRTVEIDLNNLGDMDLFPKLEIYKIGAGNIKIKNLTDEGKELTFTGLDSGETVSVDCENEIILTDKVNFYRYDDFSGNYLKLLYGTNKLQLTGNFDVYFKYNFKFLT